VASSTETKILTE